MKREELQAKKDAGTVLTAEEETFLASSESDSTEETPPTPSPTPSATDQSQRYIGILEETLREQNKQIQELMNTRPATPPAAAAPPVVDTEKEKQEFYNDPAGMTRRIINDALKASIQPLQDFVKGLKIDGSPFSNMMARFKGDARFAETLNDPQVVAAVEKIMEKAELTEVNMQSAIVHASGLKSMGLLGTVVAAPANGSPAPSTAPSPAPAPAPSTVLPPHVRPSAAPTPAPAPNGNSPARPPLTENQRRIMREQGFKSEKEYWEWMELPASDVATSTIGQAPKK